MSQGFEGILNETEGIYFVCEEVHVFAPGSSAFREKLTA